MERFLIFLLFQFVHRSLGQSPADYGFEPKGGGVWSKVFINRVGDVQRVTVAPGENGPLWGFFPNRSAAKTKEGEFYVFEEENGNKFKVPINLQLGKPPGKPYYTPRVPYVAPKNIAQRTFEAVTAPIMNLFRGGASVKNVFAKLKPSMAGVRNFFGKLCWWRKKETNPSGGTPSTQQQRK